MSFWNGPIHWPPSSNSIPSGATVWSRPPTRSRASSTSTWASACVSGQAAARPATPVPAIT